MLRELRLTLRELRLLMLWEPWLLLMLWELRLRLVCPSLWRRYYLVRFGPTMHVSNRL
jgi:hypothetical protein